MKVTDEMVSLPHARPITRRELEQKRAERTSDLERARAWRDAAVADGWSIEATYKNEPLEQHSKLTKSGFVASVESRSDSGAGWRLPSAGVVVWGPDGLQIKPGHPYSWERIQAGMLHCNNCGKDGVPTQRYSFAGRCCAECRPAMALKHESGNWTE